MRGPLTNGAPAGPALLTRAAAGHEPPHKKTRNYSAVLLLPAAGVRPQPAIQLPAAAEGWPPTPTTLMVLVEEVSLET